MTVTHVGSSKKYVAGWDKIFARGSKKKAKQRTAQAASAAKSKRGKKK